MTYLFTRQASRTHYKGKRTKCKAVRADVCYNFESDNLQESGRANVGNTSGATNAI